MRSRSITLAALLTLCCAPSLAAQNARQDQKPAARRTTYDENATAAVQIAAALVKARAENRRVLIQWGANWCGWCHLLHDHFKQDREVARTLLYEYDVVYVDVGGFDKHMGLAEQYGARLEGAGIPYLTVLDADGDVLANQPTGPLEAEGKQTHDGEKVLAFLAEHKAPPLTAESVLAAARVKANEDDKLVFLHFGAPWCGWCHRLEDWMTRPEVKRVLAKDFIDVKIDTDRMIGGGDMLEAMTGGVPSGIPWFAILRPDGEVVTTSFVDGTNLGCPWIPEEIAAFQKLLADVGTRITDEDIAMITASLGEKK